MGGLTVVSHTEENPVENDFNGSRKKKRRFRRKRSKQNNHSPSVEEALSVEALKHNVPCSDVKNLYTWALLKKEKILYSEARVLGLGPKFMSIYIPKLAIQRHIYYDEVEGLTVEWLDATSTLLLSQSMHERPDEKTSLAKFRPLDETAVIVSPINDMKLGMHLLPGDQDDGVIYNIEPLFFPLTLHRSSIIPVALHAIGGGGGTLDIVARLYVSSYFH